MYLRVGVHDQPHGPARGAVSGPRVVFRKGCPPEVVNCGEESGYGGDAGVRAGAVPRPGPVLAERKAQPARVLGFDGKWRRRRGKAASAQQELAL